MDIKPDLLEAIRYIDACTNSYSTDEQVDFESDFTKPMISFSNPGTGKTHSLVRGLILANSYYKIPGRCINAMSYTDAATAELSQRYAEACKRCNMTPTVEFNTFHKICNNIIKDAYPDMKLTGTQLREDDIQQLRQIMIGRGMLAEDMFYVRRVYETIDKLNHAFMFDEDNIRTSYDFKQLNMDMDDFQELRRKLFRDKLYSRKIAVGDIPLYALFALCKKKYIKDKYCGMYRIMVVDEFQDMTKLYLVILSMISKNLIVVGDMKQQIYGFNGADSHIADIYKQMYPEARSVNLTQSFRCKSEIAEFATKVYAPNDMSTVAFKGVSDGAEISVQPASELQLDKIVESIKEDRKNTEKTGVRKDTMFLFRNNYSITPIAEELYKQRVDFRVKNFKMVMEMPVFREVCMYADIAEDPTNIESFKNIPFIFPQYRKYRSTYFDNPVYKAALIESDKIGRNVSIFDLDMKWDASSSDILRVLKVVNKRIESDAICDSVFDLLIPLYDKYVIDGKWWTLSNTLEYYMAMVNSIITTKTYKKMKSDEYAKKSFTMDAVKLNQGVKCYTMHSAKGLEADDVYIIDADKGTFPNTKRLDKVIKSGCNYEAAKTLREERNLLYVGITRAKNKVTITYNSEITPLIKSPLNHEYSYLDSVYRGHVDNYNDLDVFKQLTNITESTGRAEVTISSSNSDVEDADLDTLEVV